MWLRESPDTPNGFDSYSALRCESCNRCPFSSQLGVGLWKFSPANGCSMWAGSSFCEVSVILLSAWATVLLMPFWRVSWGCRDNQFVEPQSRRAFRLLLPMDVIRVCLGGNHLNLSGLPNANAKLQRFSYAIPQIASLPPVVALNRNSKSQIAAKYAGFWHAIPQIALASFL